MISLKTGFIVTTVLAATFIALPPQAFSSGYEFEGIGARQVSRAGAATADADDWSTFYWNPARMVEVTAENKKEFGIELFGGEAYGKDSNSLSTLPDIGTSLGFQKDKMISPFLLGSVGFIVPAGEKWAFGAGVYTPLLQGLDFEDTSDTTGATIRYKGSAGIVVTNVSASRRVNDKVSVGAGINLLYGQIESETHIVSPLPFPFPASTVDSKLKGNGTALEGVLSVNVKPTPKWDVGFIYRSGGDINIRGNASGESVTIIPGASGQNESNFRFSLRHPPTTSLGAAYKATEKTTLTLDFAQTFWHRFNSEIRYDQPGTPLNHIPNSFDWRDTWKIKLGSKFKLSEVNELYAGYSYDRPAVDANSIDFSSTVDVPMHRVAFGGAHKWKPSFETSLGTIIGKGTRNEGGVNYELMGWQVMAETRFIF